MALHITKATLRYTLLGVVSAVLLALAWWYFFLQAKVSTLQNTSDVRGLSESAPRFRAETGSTYANLVRGSATEAGTSSPSERVPQLWRVSRTPAAGMGFESGKLLYAERGTGYVYEVDVESGKTIRLTNRLIAKAQEALFSGRAVVIRAAEGDLVSTFAGIIPDNAASSTARSISRLATSSKEMSDSLPGVYLDEDILSIALSPSGRELFYVRSTGNGSEGVRASLNGSSRKVVFTSSVSAWRPFLLADGRLFIAQNGADDIAGFAYEVRGGGLSPVVRDVPGLSFLPRTRSDSYLFSESAGGDVALRASGKEGGARFPIKTVAEKCVFSPSEASVAYCAVPTSYVSRQLLSDRYKGYVRTSDSWWKVDIESGSVDLMYESTVTLDVENPVIDDGGRRIAFINARDGTLYVLRLIASQ